MSVSDYQWRPYVSVAMRRRRAVQTIATLQRSGRVLSPVAIDGRTIARTFWGKSWCKNLEAYSDYANRLPRGRTYVRNGSVIDLRIDPGRVRALVSGSRMYDVEIEITRLARRRWKAITSQCAGQIGSMVELLQGSIARGVMEIVTRRGGGLFPAPRDISLSCSCPDWATMCKHVVAVLYGVGARLDQEPEMLFTLRDVAPAELIVAAVTDVSMTRKSGRRRLLQTEDMSSVFGIDLDLGGASEADKAPRRTRRRTKTSTKKATRTRAAAARKKPATRTTATTKSASATSTRRKMPSSKSTQAAARKTTPKTSGTGKVNARIQAVRKATATRSKKTA